MSVDVLFLIAVLALLMLGYPVAITLGGASVLFALVGWSLGMFDLALFLALPARLFGVMTNPVLVSIPLFVFMGLVLERSHLAADALEAAANLFGRSAAGVAITVTLVGMLLAASTGIVGASVVTLGVLALPVLLKQGVPPALAGGTVAAAGTLGQIIPPSIVLIVLGDQMSNAWQQMQRDAGSFAPDTVSVADLFAGALVPGLLLVASYVIFQWIMLRGKSSSAVVQENPPPTDRKIGWALGPLIVLIIAVLGSILGGIATPSEAASVGAVGALVLAGRRLNWSMMRDVVYGSAHLVSMIFLIVIGASIFSLVFRGLGGDDTISAFLSALPGGTYSAVLLVMLVIFLLGFFLEFLEIAFVVVPLVAPVLLAMPLADGSPMSPVWLGVLIAINLQTSFLTPPFGLSLFYLRSVAPPALETVHLYRGIIPFVLLQLLTLAIVMVFPSLVTVLPTILFGS